MKVKPDWFLLGLFLAVGLAWAFPGPGSTGGWMYPQVLTKVAISLIFFLHGISLPLATLKAGTLKWQVHLIVQLATFALFPLVGVAIWGLAGDAMTPDLKLGYFYLCALPSTVSSSVALTAAARGNVAAAVFNATLSSLLGVFLTPLWLGIVLHASSVALPLGEVILGLVRWLVAPLVIGQALRPLVSRYVARYRRRIGYVDRATILLLVYTSFCDSFQGGVWSRHGWGTVGATMAASAVIFYVMTGLIRGACRALHFETEDRIAAIFCGSQKTLASGVPMAQLIFAGHPGIGVILLPIMIYHALQLVLSGGLAGRWAARPATIVAES